MNGLNYCKICGFRYDGYYPWGLDNVTPTYDLCLCCGAEFGFDDCSPEDIQAYREKWINEGAKFHSLSQCPENWDAKEQLKNNGLFRPEGAQHNSPGQSEAPPWVTVPTRKQPP